MQRRGRRRPIQHDGIVTWLHPAVGFGESSWRRNMTPSRNAKLMCGITLLIIPTIMYGGWTLLGILTHGSAGPPAGGLKLNETQWALWRAGHAHAGVWTVLSLLLQLLLDGARLPGGFVWLARICAPLSAVALSGAFFGLAFHASFSALLYLGIGLMLVALLTTAVGLLRGVAGGAAGPAP